MTSMEKFCHFWSIFLLRKKVHTSDQIVRPKFFWWKISSKKSSTDIGIKISRSRRIFKRDWILSPSWPHIKCLDFTPPPPPPHCPSSFWKIYPFCPEPALLFGALLLFVRITKKNTHTHINSTFTNSWKKSSDTSHLAVSQRFASFRKN